MDEFMPEAWTMAPSAIIENLRDMGVEETLIQHAEVDVRLLAALYIYIHVEAMNMPDPLSELLDGDPWHCGHDQCAQNRTCTYV